MLKNTTTGYGLIAILLHWLMALAIFGMFGLGLYMVELTYYDSWYHGSLETHKSIGIVVAMVWIARLGWRLLNPTPKGLSEKSLENSAAHLAHIALYALMLALMVSGYLISTADGHPINVFDLFSVPATLTGENQEDVAGDIHEVLAWLLMAMVAVHALAALKHHLVSKDNTLRRMIRPGL
jgi:cytochrome b561